MNADLLDVHILDITAQIEALLRGVRELQRDLLKVRGAVVTPRSPDGRLAAARDAQARLAAMLQVCDVLKAAAQDAAGLATTLPETIAAD